MRAQNVLHRKASSPPRAEDKLVPSARCDRQHRLTVFHRPPARPILFGCPPDQDRMSALGQKQTLGKVQLMSALPPKADMDRRGRDVRFAPENGLGQT